MATGLLDYLGSLKKRRGKDKSKTTEGEARAMQVAGGSLWDSLEGLKPNRRFQATPPEPWGNPARAVPMPSPKMKFPFRDVLGRIWTEEEWIKNQQRQAEQRRRQAERMNLPEGLKLL